VIGWFWIPYPRNEYDRKCFGTFVTIDDDVAEAERNGGFVVAAVAAVVDVTNDADDFADNADDVFGDSFILGGLV